MTNEEAIERLEELLKGTYVVQDKEDIQAVQMAIQALDFAEFVAYEIIDERFNDRFNADAFKEISCRKLGRIGIVKKDADSWVFNKGA